MGVRIDGAVVQYVALQLRHPDPPGHLQLAHGDGDAVGHLRLDRGQVPILQERWDRLEGA